MDELSKAELEAHLDYGYGKIHYQLTQEIIKKLLSLITMNGSNIVLFIHIF